MTCSKKSAGLAYVVIGLDSINLSLPGESSRITREPIFYPRDGFKRYDYSNVSEPKCNGVLHFVKHIVRQDSVLYSIELLADAENSVFAVRQAFRSGSEVEQTQNHVSQNVHEETLRTLSHGDSFVVRIYLHVDFEKQKDCIPYFSGFY
jgi:hypothetical protein